MGYSIEEVLGKYYVDGEDAYLMRKVLSTDDVVKDEEEDVEVDEDVMSAGGGRQ
jgi:hypothetical protein